MKQIIFGRFESSCLLINIVCAKLLFMAPRLFTNHSVSAPLMVLGIDFLLTILFVFLFLKLMPDEELDLFDLAQKYIGNWAKILLAATGAILFLFKFIAHIRIFSGLISNESYNIAPIWFLNLAFYLCIIIVAFLGMETVVRLGALLVPFFSIILLIIISLSFSSFDINLLFPLFGQGIISVFDDVKISLNYFSDLYVILLLLPHLRKKRLLISSAKISLIISFILTAFVVVLFCGVVPISIKNEVISPVFLLVQMASVSGHVIQLDVFLLFIWNIFGVLYLAASFFFCALCTKKAFGLENYRPVLFPLGVMTFSVSLLAEEHGLIGFIYSNSYWIGEILGIVLPIIILAVISIKIKSRSVKT